VAASEIFFCLLLSNNSHSLPLVLNKRFSPNYFYNHIAVAFPQLSVVIDLRYAFKKRKTYGLDINTLNILFFITKNGIDM
jgi:hypothetical protein